MFNNTTIGAFIPGMAIGVFGVDTTEIAVSNSTTNGIYRITSGGSGYGANALVTLTFANGGTNVTAANSVVNSTSNAGRITSILSNSAIVNSISGSVTVTIAAPASITIVANSTGFSNSADTLLITTANSKFQVNDRVYYGVPTGNSAIAPLTGNSYYYINAVNSTSIKVMSALGGSAIDITDARVTNPGESHTIQGDTATGLLIPGGLGTRAGLTHSGWVVRKEGTGGRAGRVSYEVLVAMGSLGAQSAAYGTAALVPDASDNIVLANT
jgi:hypothetical protein